MPISLLDRGMLLIQLSRMIIDNNFYPLSHRQIIAIARAIVHQSKVLLLDEGEGNCVCDWWIAY